MQVVIANVADFRMFFTQISKLGGFAMIVDFTVKNFKSIKEEQTLSMFVSGSKKEHENNIFSSSTEKQINLLKSAVIYGPNASGKTNVIKAIDYFRNLILDSTDLKVDQKIPEYFPFKLDKDNKSKPIAFELEFMLKTSMRYRYSVMFDEQEILKEELVFFPKKQESRLFLREKGKPILFGPALKGRKKSIEAELLPNQLFLSRAANSNQEKMKEIYLYFRYHLRFQISAPGSANIFPNIVLELKKNNNTFKKKLIDFLVAADTGIQSIDIEKRELKDLVFESGSQDMPEEIKKIREQMLEVLKYRPVTIHKSYRGEKEAGTIRFDIDEESNGTRRMLGLAWNIIRALEEGYTFIIDELDSSLHPHLSRYIIELFHDPETNPNNAQLIFTTHDTSLLDSDLFRRDQVWFTSKDKYGATQLFSLDEFDKNQVRSEGPFEKWYLGGRFGATPFIDRNRFIIEKKEVSS